MFKGQLVSFVPRPCPAFHHLKLGRAWVSQSLMSYTHLYGILQSDSSSLRERERERESNLAQCDKKSLSKQQAFLFKEGLAQCYLMLPQAIILCPRYDCRESIRHYRGCSSQNTQGKQAPPNSCVYDKNICKQATQMYSSLSADCYHRYIAMFPHSSPEI